MSVRALISGRRRDADFFCVIEGGEIVCAPAILFFFDSLS